MPKIVADLVFAPSPEAGKHLHANARAAKLRDEPQAWTRGSLLLLALGAHIAVILLAIHTQKHLASPQEIRGAYLIERY